MFGCEDDLALNLLPLVGTEVTLWHWINLYTLLCIQQNNTRIFYEDMDLKTQMQQLRAGNLTIFDVYKYLCHQKVEPSWQLFFCNYMCFVPRTFQERHVKLKQLWTSEISKLRNAKINHSKSKKIHCKYMCLVVSALSCVTCCLCMPCIVASAIKTQPKKENTDILKECTAQVLVEIEKLLHLWYLEFLNKQDADQIAKYIPILPVALKELILKFLVI